jgi:hypothetical protein
MSDHSEAFVAFDTSKLRNTVAIADGGRSGEVRFLGEIENSAAATAKLVRKLAGKYGRLTFCYEAGPTGYGLCRQISSLGHACIVAAPSLIPKKPGDRVKTNRRDAVNLAKLLRAGELTAVWVPDPRHEAMRELSREREAAVLPHRPQRLRDRAYRREHAQTPRARACLTAYPKLRLGLEYLLGVSSRQRIELRQQIAADRGRPLAQIWFCRCCQIDNTVTQFVGSNHRR